MPKAIVKKKRARARISFGLITAVAIIPSAKADIAATNSVAVPAPAPTHALLWQKPSWLTDLSAGVRESYDDNTLGVSGQGMQPAGSWITGVSAKAGVDFAPLLGADSPYKALTLVYAPDFYIYHNTPQESYNAQRVFNTIRMTDENCSLIATNCFLYNDGNTVAPIYALNQTSNTNDRFRNFYAQTMPRERRSQIQDRALVAMQYDSDNMFVRPTASLLYYNLNTVLHNNGEAPYIGYQNWPDRADVNGGLDWGYRVTQSLAIIAGYRYGYQYQAQFSEEISPMDRHYSSNNYQRVLVGLEGKLWSWLNISIAGGPDFRDYNPNAAVDNLNPIYPFVEGTIAASITPNQTLTFYTKEWQWVSSTGLVPYYDSMYVLNYRWNATRQLGFDLGGKILNANFLDGNDLIGPQPSQRNDIQYCISAGVTYAFTPNLSANLTYGFNMGRNLLNNAIEAAYRNFNQNVVSLGVQFKF
ncbi:MAG TPA: hypothetical protein VMH87_16720 [Pseudomonadales bacterium]|nr:hypothetical protein [Pseudomonadales bacterium]